MTEGKLVFQPKGYRVVPEEPTIEQIDAGYIAATNSLPRRAHPISKTYTAMIKAAPQLTTPPVLRWDGDSLKFMGAELAYVSMIYGVWQPHLMSKVSIDHPLFAEGTEQEARRAAEKALGFPDWIVVEEV